MGDAGTITVAGRSIPVGNIAFAAPNFTNQRNFVLNLDFTQTDKTQHRSRFIFNRFRAIDNTAVLPVFYALVPNDSRLFSYTLLHAFTPKLSNELRLAYRRNVQEFPVPGGFSFPGLDVFPNIGLLSSASTRSQSECAAGRH